MGENYDNNPAIVGLARRTMGLVRFIYELQLKKRTGTILRGSEGYDDRIRFVELEEYIAYLYSLQGREYKLVIYLFGDRDERVTIYSSPIKIEYQIGDGCLWDEVVVEQEVLRKVLRRIYKIMLDIALRRV